MERHDVLASLCCLKVGYNAAPITSAVTQEFVMKKSIIAAGACSIALLFLCSVAGAYDDPVEKKVFTLPTYTTVGGKTIKNVRVGYETYGKLNATGDNAIFV